MLEAFTISSDSRLISYIDDSDWKEIGANLQLLAIYYSIADAMIYSAFHYITDIMIYSVLQYITDAIIYSTLHYITDMIYSVLKFGKKRNIYKEGFRELLSNRCLIYGYIDWYQ